MTRYTGNDVAYGSGGLWHVWIDVTDDGSNTGTTTNVHYTYGVYFNGNIADDLTAVNRSDYWGAGSNDGYYCSGSGNHTVAGPATNAAPIQYGGGNSIHFHMDAGPLHYTGGGTSSVVFDYPMPARTGTPPTSATVPGAPGTGASAITSHGAWIAVSAPSNNGGANVDAYETYVLTNNEWPGAGGVIVNSWGGGGGQAYGLTRYTNYKYTARAHNRIGWSAWAGMKSFWTLATVPDTPAHPGFRYITQDSVTVWYTEPLSGGSAITGHTIQVATDAEFTAVVATVTSTGQTVSVTGLDPNTTYYARFWASNAMGHGNWSPEGVFTTLPGVHLRVSGAWVNAKPHNRVSGAWVSSKTHGRVSGAWS